MHKIVTNKFDLLLGILFIIPPILFTALCSDRFLKEYSYFIYLYQFTLFYIYVFTRQLKYKVIFSPIFIGLNFILIYFITGAYTTPNDIGGKTICGDVDFTSVFWGIKNYRSILMFFIFSITVLFLLFVKNREFYIRNQCDKYIVHNISNFRVSISFLFLVVILILKRYLSFISIIEFSSIFLFVYAMCIILRDKNTIVRYMMYVAMLMISAAMLYHNKRNIVFILLLIMFNEIPLEKRIVFSYKIFFKTLGVFGLLFSLIIVASILRGYGNFDISFSDLSLYYAFIQYFEMDGILEILADNFEISTVYFNAVNCVDFFLAHKIDYELGASFIKPLMIILDREVFTFKPMGFILIYTKNFVPGFYYVGGSLPTTFLGEIFGNFYYFGVIILFFLMSLFEKVYQYFLKNKFLYNRYSVGAALIVILTFPQYLRGSGLDLLLGNCIYLFPMYFVLFYKLN